MRKPALFPIELVIHFHWDKTNNIRKVFNASIKFQKQHNNPLGNRRFKPTIKIEEQMLYIIEQNKKINQQQLEIKKLKDLEKRLEAIEVKLK